MALRLAPHGWETLRYRKWYQIRYRLPMAMNLRLPDELAERLRALADETGRSQQVLVRAAVEQFLDQQELKHLNPWLRAHVKPPIGDHRPLLDSQQIERAPKSGLSYLLRLGRDAQ